MMGPGSGKASSLDNAPRGNQKAHDRRDHSHRPDGNSPDLKDLVSETVGCKQQEYGSDKSDQYDDATEPATVETRFTRHG